MRLNAIEDIEEAIVSWVIHNGEHFHIVAEKLVPDDFSQSSLGPIWRCFNWLASNEKSITPETVSYRLEQINAASSLKALPNLSTPTNDGSAIRTYVELVHKESQRRRLAQTLKRYASVVEQTPDINLDALLHELDGEIHTTKQHHAEQEPTLEEAVKKVLEAQERFLDGEGTGNRKPGPARAQRSDGRRQSKRLCNRCRTPISRQDAVSHTECLGKQSS